MKPALQRSKFKASENPLRQFPISYTPTNEAESYLKPDFEGNSSGMPVPLQFGLLKKSFQILMIQPKLLQYGPQK